MWWMSFGGPAFHLLALMRSRLMRFMLHPLLGTGPCFGLSFLQFVLSIVAVVSRCQRIAHLGRFCRYCPACGQKEQATHEAHNRNSGPSLEQDYVA